MVEKGDPPGRERERTTSNYSAFVSLVDFTSSEIMSE